MTNFPLTKFIHIWQLSLNTIEWIAKSMIFLKYYKFSEKIRIFEKLYKNFLKIKKSAITQKYYHIFFKFSRKEIFFTIFCFFPSIFLFLRSPYGFTAGNIGLKLHIVKNITKGNNWPQADFFIF